MINKYDVSNFPYMADMFPDFYDRECWCCNLFGLGIDRWRLIGNHIYFKNEEDRNWFILRWS